MRTRDTTVRLRRNEYYKLKDLTPTRKIDIKKLYRSSKIAQRYQSVVSFTVIFWDNIHFQRQLQNGLLYRPLGAKKKKRKISVMRIMQFWQRDNLSLIKRVDNLTYSQNKLQSAGQLVLLTFIDWITFLLSFFGGSDSVLYNYPSLPS